MHCSVIMQNPRGKGNIIQILPCNLSSVLHVFITCFTKVQFSLWAHVFCETKTHNDIKYYRFYIQTANVLQLVKLML